jgi:hypothetical protein
MVVREERIITEILDVETSPVKDEIAIRGAGLPAAEVLYKYSLPASEKIAGNIEL